jgi:multisubunit Na+/H+ antiporter MnhG subunit
LFSPFLVHAAKLGFAVIIDRAIDRTSGTGSAADEGLNIGQFASISSVIRSYFGANDYTQIRNFGLLLAMLGVIAVIAFLDREYGWFLGEDRRKLRALAFAFLVSLAAPMSWFILAKAHAFAHQPIDFILWHVPTVPLGCAMAALAASQAIGERRKWVDSLPRSFLTLAIPAVILLTVALVVILDRRQQGNMGVASARSRRRSLPMPTSVLTCA